MKKPALLPLFASIFYFLKVNKRKKSNQSPALSLELKKD